MKLSRMLHCISLCLFMWFSAGAFAGDWGMWRYDANRSAASPHSLPADLRLLWVRDYPALEPVWDDPLNQDLMQFDNFYEPVVMGSRLFIGSNHFDRIAAIDTNTGEELWTYYTNGPVRFPPVARDGKVWFTSDDGYLYCLNAEDGSLLWKYSGIPQDRKILGNERLISTWPARGGPVLKDGVVYFASGIWPFMGIFICALDAESGEEIWVNDSCGSTYMNQPHNSPSFAGVAPQGTMVVAGDYLLVPGGRSVPACFNRHTGEQEYYHLARYGKTGGAFTCAIGDRFVNYHRDQVTSIYDVPTGELILGRFGNIPVLTPEIWYSLGDHITAYDFANIKKEEKQKQVLNKQTNQMETQTEVVWILNELWKLDADATYDLIKAGDQLYAGGNHKVTAIQLGETPKEFWSAEIEGNASRLIAADDKLFVVTDGGRIYAFGGNTVEVKHYAWQPEKPVLPHEIQQQAQSIIKESGIDEGYCLIYGLDNGDLAQALVENSQLNVIAIEEDESKVEALRESFVKSGLYGKRLSVILANNQSFSPPAYLASLIVVNQLDDFIANANQGVLSKWYEGVRPYGGVLIADAKSPSSEAFYHTLQTSDLPKANVQKRGDYVLAVREGALPGSDDWTHQYGDIANTVKSDDERVQLPLGILWFGGSSNMDVLPRHGHGPPEQIVGGRLFIEGMDSMSARDVYTGRVLWTRKIENLGNYGVYYDDTYKDTPLDTAYNQIHIPGANARGTNYVVTEDKIYVIQGDRCLVLDPVTGNDLGVINLPREGSDDQHDWGYIGVYKDYLIAGMDFVSYMDFIDIAPTVAANKKVFFNYDITSSKKLLVMNRHSGDVLWTFDSELGLNHNAICVGNDTVFAIDRVPDVVSDSLKRRGQTIQGTPRLVAFDIASGNIRWDRTENVFGTWLGYSEKHDILLQAVRASRDMLTNEPSKGMAAYKVFDGTPLWKHDERYGGPAILHHETIYTDPNAYSLLTGEPVFRENPITGELSRWSFTRTYGCNYAVASECLMTFRSAAAGFFDLTQDGGTGNFGGFKSGCTSNLIAANGVLNAPDYTRTCSCSYQNQTSLAMIHDPNVEIWTYNPLETEGGAIRRLGINFGAPGDRRAENGTLWLEYPFRGGPSPDVSIKTLPEEIQWYQHHSSRFEGEGLPWVTASGLNSAGEINIRLDRDSNEDKLYTVKLYFAEPTQKGNERRFNLSLQNEWILKDFSVQEESGSSHKGVVKEFPHISVKNDLVIKLEKSGSGALEPILCGVEIIQEIES